MNTSESLSLNSSALEYADMLANQWCSEFRCRTTEVSDGGRLIDLGVEVPGGLEAGLWLAETCLAGLGKVVLTTAALGDRLWPHIQVYSDHPVPACLYSQYAGWQLSLGKFFAMGSGPMRAAAFTEAIFKEHGYRETPDDIVGVLEGRALPTADVYAEIAAKTGVPAERITLLIAPTASQAGNVQVVARSVETALHKLHELKFDVRRIQSAMGTAPLPPVGKHDMAGIGLTNDSILYGARVMLWVRGDDESIAEIGPRIPSRSSSMYGEPFRKIFEAAGRDFYKIDPQLFSPAEITIQNLDTGSIHVFGNVATSILERSFGLVTGT